MPLREKDIRKLGEIVRDLDPPVNPDDAEAVAALLASLVPKFQGRFPPADIEPHLMQALAAAACGDAEVGSAGAAAPQGQGAGATAAATDATAQTDDLAEPATLTSGAAPYRFVPLANTVLPSPVPRDDLSHGRPLKDGVSGTLRVTWTVQTPLLIGDPQPERLPNGNRGPVYKPFMLDDQTFAIPGASLRGAIRSVLEPATYSRMSRLNDHLRFAVRDFQNAHYQEHLMQADEVRAGWLRRAGQGAAARYEIVPCSWARLPAEQIEARTGVNDWVNLPLQTKLNRLRTTNSLSGDVRLSISPAGSTAGGYADIDAGGEMVGRVVVSGKAPPSSPEFRKKNDYVFFSDMASSNPAPGPAFVPAGEAYPVHESVIDLFHRLHSNQGQDPPVPQGSWAHWKQHFDRGEWVPVFIAGPRKDDRDSWIGRDAADGLWLGLTRLFRMPTKYSVGQIRDFSDAHSARPSDQGKHPLLDFAEALFGYVDEPDADGNFADASLPRNLKSRVMIGFATTPAQGARVDTEPHRTVMMGAKPEFYPYYLRNASQNGYNTNAARLSGWKRYPVKPLRDLGGGRTLPDLPRDRQGGQNEQTASYLKFLHPTRTDGSAVVFSGDIHVHNLLPCELGALLWAITFGQTDGSLCHGLGHAKPFGYGQVKPHVTLTVRRNDGEQPDTVDGYLKTFRTHMDVQLGGGVAFEQRAQIKALRAMADPVKGAFESRNGSLSYPPEGYVGYKEVKTAGNSLSTYQPRV